MENYNLWFSKATNPNFKFFGLSIKYNKIYSLIIYSNCNGYVILLNYKFKSYKRIKYERKIKKSKSISTSI